MDKSVAELEKELQQAQEEGEIIIPVEQHIATLQFLRDQELAAFDLRKTAAKVNKNIGNDQAAQARFAEAQTCLDFIKEIDKELEQLKH